VREAAAVAAGFVAVIVVFTVLAGGRLSLGTSASGPYANFGFTGPTNR
jgi:hypothetical protein